MVEELKTIEMGFTDYIAARQKEFDWLRQGKEQGYAEGIVTGREEGISIGLEQGAYQAKLETALKLIVRGYSPEEIADISDLSIDQVQSLMVSLEQL